MRISVCGLGYVGSVTAACLANDGHEVTGVDTNPQKVQSLCAGRSPVIEPGLEAMISGGGQWRDAEGLPGHAVGSEWQRSPR